MEKQKPKAKKARPQENMRRWLQMAGEWLLRRLFGMTRGWEKFRDITRNNYELGLEHLRLGNIDDAILRFRLVTWLEPNHAEGWYYLGCAYLADDKTPLAKKALTRALQLKPGSEEAAYMLAIADGNTTPADKLPKKIPPSLSRAHFDSLAADYNREQLEELQYQGHIALADAVRACLVPGRIDHIILELGVGTGLAGSRLRDMAANITGVDFSANMLAEAMALKDAQGKQIYDALIKRDITQFLPEIADRAFDIVLAAGTLSYIGELEAIFRQTARVLKPGGIFAFTADSMDGQGFQLDAGAGRFRFSKPYLQSLAAACGLQEVKFEEAETYPGYKAWLCVFAN